MAEMRTDESTERMQNVEQTRVTRCWPPARACGHEKEERGCNAPISQPGQEKAPWTGPCREMKKKSRLDFRSLQPLLEELCHKGPLLIKMLFADFLRSSKPVAAMVHLLSLFFAFVGLSLVAHAAKDCDGTLRFDVLNTIDDREIFSHRPTDSLEDCIKTCYSKSDFCFSVLFIPSKTGKHQCLLSYHAAYMCSKRKLISEHPPVQEPTLVECIRCVGSVETKGKEAKKVTTISTPRPTVSESEESGIFEIKTETAEATTTITAEEQETTVAEELETTTTVKSTMTTAQETKTAATTAELGTETAEESEITTTKESEITPELETTAVDEVETIVTQDANFSTTSEITTEKVAKFTPESSSAIASMTTTVKAATNQSEEESEEMIGETEKSDKNQENNNNTVVDEIVESSAESEAKSEETTIEEFTPETTVPEGSAEGTTEDLIGGSGMKTDENEHASNTTDDHTLKEIMESEIAFVTEEFEYEEFKESIKGKETSSALGSDELEVDELLRTTVQQISKKPADQDYTNSEDVDEIFTDNSTTTTTVANPNKESLRKKEDRDFVDSIERAMAFEHDASPETVQTAASNGSDESGNAGQNEQKEVEVIDNEDDDNDDDDHDNEQLNNEQSSSLTFHDKKTNFDLKSNFENKQTAVQNQPKALCTDGLSFQTKLASSHSGIVYSQEAPANSTQDCVEICHARRCSSGVFLKPVLSGESGNCLMAFGGETCDEDLERVSRYDGPSPVEIHCIRCGSYSLDSKPQISKIAEKTISSEIKDFSKEDKQITTASDVKTKLQSKAQQSCAGRITFEVVEPNRHRKGDFVTHELARSVADCARICFERGCTVAGFSQASVETDPSFCLLSFKSDTCSGLSRVDQLKSAEHSVQIQCIRCETASTSAEKSDKQPETAAVTESAKVVTECEGGNCIPTSSKKTMNSELVKEEQSKVPEKEKCSNDLSFQVFQPGERQTANFTSDRRSESAAHCARLCYESETCELAAYIAAPKGLSSGVCLLSEDAGYCASNAEHVVQHSSVSPFLITCITCSKCTFNVKNYVPVKQDDAAWDTFFDDFEMQVDAKNIHECAEKCASRRCTLAVYSGQTKHGNCLMTIKANRSCGAEKSHEIVDTSGKLPVLIDCVQCAA
ncbi:hypothetical protein T4A_10161 [Trichinella pseudospiralis]|uniref:Apple domain-containing protein n=1 Tax=Trichinella pseudospiralis TaxID=6337 RepID=A0A0V1E9M7_TRIPS|nr:hypothetical protein T4A_10161 [Trichinella pseudospiralis]